MLPGFGIVPPIVHSTVPGIMGIKVEAEIMRLLPIEAVDGRRLFALHEIGLVSFIVNSGNVDAVGLRGIEIKGAAGIQAISCRVQQRIDGSGITDDRDMRIQLGNAPNDGISEISGPAEVDGADAVRTCIDDPIDDEEIIAYADSGREVWLPAMRSYEQRCEQP